MGEQEVKAAYIYNFAIYVEWPADAFQDKDSPIVVCVLGNEGFGEVLRNSIRDKKAQDRKIVVVSAKAAEEIKPPCHILFVADAEKQNLEKALKAVKDQKALVVGESEGLAQKGAIFNFFLENNRVRFEANTAAAARSGLKIGAKLLRIARIVTDSGK